MKLKLIVPTELKDIKLSQYQKYVSTTKDSKDANFMNRQLVGIFCNIPDDVVGSIRASDFNSIVNNVSVILQQKGKFVDRFELDGVNYGFIPKIEDITVDEKADLDTFLTDWETFNFACGVCYRPIKSKYKNTYEIEDYKGIKTSLDVTLDVAFGLNVFFSSLINDLLTFIPNSIGEVLEQEPKLLQTLAQNGDGTIPFTQLLKETCSSLKTLVN